MTDELLNDLHALKTLVSVRWAETERLKMMLEKLRQTQFGRISEQRDAMIEQLRLSLEELWFSQAQPPEFAIVFAPRTGVYCRTSGYSDRRIAALERFSNLQKISEAA